MSRRKAPKRKVTEIWRTGSYGNVTWHHRLECGHVESRKRQAAADHIGCVTCLNSTPADKHLAPADTHFTEPGLDRPFLISGIARHFGVQQELVDIGLDYETGELSYATVMFDRAALKRLGFLA